MATILAAMESEVDRLAVEVVGQLREALPWYASIPPAELLPGVRTSLAFGLAAVKEQRLPTVEEAGALAEVAEVRAHQHLPLEAVLAAYQIGARELRAQATARARSAGIGPALLLDAADLVWAWTDSVTRQAASAHRRAEVMLARHDQQQRTGLLQALLAGSLSPAEANQRALAYGMTLDSRYAALRARPAQGVALYQVEQNLVGRWTGRPLLLGIVDGELTGAVGGTEVVASGLGGIEALGTLAFGPAGPLSQLSVSFAIATRVLDAAVALDVRGSCRIDDLGVRLAVASDADVGDALTRRYLDPLEAHRRGQQLLESIEALLAHGLSVDAAARALCVHPNTLRYRIRQVHTLTGADLAQTDDIVALWWALQRRRFRPRAQAPANTAST